MIGPLAVALLLSGSARAEAAPGVRWERSFDEAQRKARAAGKPMMVDFWASWCGWCRRLDRTTYLDARVARLSEGFVPVKVNTEGGPREAAIASRYDVNSLPTIVFLTPHGRLILRIDGYQGPGQFPLTQEQARETASRVMGWEATLDKRPDDAAALLGLGAHLFELESYGESRELLAKAARLDGERPTQDRKRTRMLLGALFKSYNRNYQEAEAVLKEGLALTPPGDYDAKLLYVLGKTYLSWGKRPEARAVLQAILNDHAESPMAERARETLASLDRR